MSTPLSFCLVVHEIVVRAARSRCHRTPSIMEQPATHAGSVSEGAADNEHLTEQLSAKSVPQDDERDFDPTRHIRFPPRREELPSVPPAKKPRTFGLPAALASPRPRGLTRASSSARRREIYETNERSVVIIQAAQLPQQFLMPQQFPICQGQAPRELSKGSGFVWDDEGHVVTNYHVIAKAQLATVTINVGGGELKEYHANLCGADPENDIAVLKVWAPRSVLKPITCGSSSEVSKGDTVFTIGHPYGFDFFFTKGMVNAVGDNESPSNPNVIIKGCIVSDSDIGPGSSGGPLLDGNGHLVGLNFAHMVKNNSISLSVPLDTVRRFVNSWPLAPIARSPELIANHNPIHKYRNALAAAKRALTEIHETSDDVSVRAASGLAEISEALEGEDLPGIRLAVALGAR